MSNRPQFVQPFNVVVSNTGAPQGTVVSPFLFTLQISSIETWCNRNHLLLNVDRTKEMAINFGRMRTATKHIIIIGGKVGVLDHYRYLGVHLNSS